MQPLRGALKPLEIAFRRFVVRLLRLFIRRGGSGLEGIDPASAKILFVRQDRIGDVLISTPLFALVKQAFPGAVVDVLLSSNNFFVLQNDPVVRTVWVYRKKLPAIVSLLRAVRRERYDLVIDLIDNASATSTVFCLLAGGRRTIGLEKENSFAYDIICPMRSRRDVHIVERLAELLVPLGITADPVQLRPRYTVSPEHTARAAEFIAGNFPLSVPIIAVNISAGEGARDWGNENYRELVQELSQRHPAVHLLLLYKPGHADRAAAVGAGIERCVISPVTKEFDEFAAYIQQSRMLITADTSAVHLAAAFGVPEVVLYVQSNKDLRIWDPYGVDHEALVADVDDLKVLGLTDVLAATERLLSRTGIGK